MRLNDDNMPAINIMSVATGWGATGEWGIVECPRVYGSNLFHIIIVMPNTSFLKVNSHVQEQALVLYSN